MKKSTLLIGALSAATLLSACGGGYGYGYREAGYGLEGDVYYDGAYGPYSDGYWRNDGFYYRGADGRFLRDEGRHFRRDRFDGGRMYHWRHRD